MVLLRPQTLAAMTEERPLPRNLLAVIGVQRVSRGKVLWTSRISWLRNPPYTVGVWAHNGQIEARLKFASTAKKARGVKGLVMTDIGLLPPAAAQIHKEMKGYTAPDRLRPELYPSRVKRTVANEIELREEAARRRLPAPT